MKNTIKEFLKDKKHLEMKLQRVFPIINTGVKCLYCGTKYEIEPKTNCKNCGANEYRRA